MTNIIPFKFDSNEIRVITDASGDPWFVLTDVLQAMTSCVPVTTAKSTIIEGLGDGFTDDKPIQDSIGRTQKTTIINESAVTFLVSRSNTETGKRLNRFIHVELLPSIRKTGKYEAPAQPKKQSALSHLKSQLVFAKHIEKSLRLSDTSKIRMYAAIAEENGLPSKLLPDYSTADDLTKSMGGLLKDHKVNLSAKAANMILERLGYIKTLERRSTGNTIKEFKSITEKGLAFGRNETAPQSPN